MFIENYGRLDSVFKKKFLTEELDPKNTKLDIDEFYNGSFNHTLEKPYIGNYNFQIPASNIALVEEEEDDIYYNEYKDPRNKDMKDYVRGKYQYKEGFANINPKTEHLGDYDVHQKFLEHIKTCAQCRKIVLETYDVNDNSELFNLFLYILTGVFVLFLLDFFFKLGSK